MYKEAGFNFFAGCLLVFVTFLVFIGLYCVLSNVVFEGLFMDGFYWIFFFGGLMFIVFCNVGSGFVWFWSFVDGYFSFGWYDIIVYLVFLVLFVVF